eukprot:COSAG02_NODE_14008_length_1322_cov_1.125920_1_plen_180_part_10
MDGPRGILTRGTAYIKSAKSAFHHGVKAVQSSSVVRDLEKKAVKKGADVLRGVAETATDGLADSALTALGAPELAPLADRDLYKQIAGKLGRSTTYSSEIEKVGSQLLGADWGGVHAADTLPPVSQKFQCYVCNVATTTDGSGGIHWLACVDQDGKRYFNDPLGTTGQAQATTLRQLHPG